MTTSTIIRAGPWDDGGTAEGQGLFVDGRRAIMADVRFEIDEKAKTLLIEQANAPLTTWPLDTLRTVPDQADDRDALTLTSTRNPLARLVLRDAQDQAIVRFRALNLHKKPPVKGKARIFAWAAGAIASVFAIIFLLVPLLADQLAKVLPVRGELALGEATLEQIQSALGNDVAGIVPFCSSPEGDAALAKMQQRLQGDGLNLPYDVTVSVLDHDMLNAFALPGGQVVFFRGLIDAATDPDQVAAVMAHEIGHVVARDPTRHALRSAGSIGVLGLLFGDFAGGAVVLLMVEQLIQSDYRQDAEAAADDFGIQMLLDANVDTGALGDLFQIMVDRYGEANSIAQHFASHPALGDRIENARAAGEGAGPTTPTLSDEEWQALQNICDTEEKE